MQPTAVISARTGWQSVWQSTTDSHDVLQDERVVSQLVELSVVGRCVDYLKEGSSQHAGLLAMLLSNVTLSKPGASSLLQLSNPQLQGYHM